MSYHPRIAPATSAHFITLRLADPLRGDLVDHIDLLRHAMRHTMSRHPLAIDAICVLPNRLHAIWALPEGNADLGPRIGLVKSTFTFALKQRPGGDHCRPWQRRTWSHPLADDAALALHRAMIYHAPVQAGLCATPEAWPHSSLHRDRLTGKTVTTLMPDTLAALPGKQMALPLCPAPIAKCK